MAIATTTALILGATALGAAGIAASQASKARKSQERVQQQKVEAQQKATTEVLAAPEKASEKARVDSLQRRKRRSKTVLTSKTGVLEPETLAKKSLLGA